MESSIENRALDLLAKLVVRKKTDHSLAEAQILPASLKERESFILPQAESKSGIMRRITNEGLLLEIQFYDSISEISLIEDGLAKFQSLVDAVIENSEYGSVCSRDFLESTLFEWIIARFKYGETQIKLKSHLETETSKVCEDTEFYFHLTNLHLDVHFNIASVELLHLSKKHWDDYFVRLNSDKQRITEEQFNRIYRKDFQGNAIAKIRVKAERKKAEEIAKERVELAVDVLKVFCLVLPLPDITTFFDLSYRLNYQTENVFLTKPGISDFDFALNLSFPNRNDVVIDAKVLEDIRRLGLSKMSQFITSKVNSEMYRFLIAAIQNFSFALSVSDLHRRCVELIMTIEGLLLEEKAKNKTKKVIERMSKILMGAPTDKQEYSTVIAHVYGIRHSMVHQASRSSIQIDLLIKFQFYLTVFILRLTEMSTQEKIQTKEALLTKLDAIS